MKRGFCVDIRGSRGFIGKSDYIILLGKYKFVLSFKAQQGFET